MATIKVNIGGRMFETTQQTLEGSGYFTAALSPALADQEILFVDRSSEAFEHVLALLRDPDYPYPEEHLKEADFYILKQAPQRIKKSLESRLRQMTRANESLGLQLQQVTEALVELKTELQMIKLYSHWNFQSTYLMNERCAFSIYCFEKAAGHYCDKHTELLNKLRRLSKEAEREGVATERARLKEYASRDDLTFL